MKTRIGKFVLLPLAIMGLIGSMATTSQAGVIPWLFDAVFGPSRYACAPRYYSPCGPTPRAAYYAPRSYNACRPMIAYYPPPWTPYAWNCSPCYNSCRVAVNSKATSKAATSKAKTFAGQDETGWKTNRNNEGSNSGSTDDVEAPENPDEAATNADGSTITIRRRAPSPDVNDIGGADAAGTDKQDGDKQNTQDGEKQEIQDDEKQKQAAEENAKDDKENDAKAKSSEKEEEDPFKRPIPRKAGDNSKDVNKDEAESEKNNAKETEGQKEIEKIQSWRYLPQRRRLARQHRIADTIVKRQSIDVNAKWFASVAGSQIAKK